VFGQSFFKKIAGLGAAPQKTPFLFDSFFFAAPSDKEKAAVGACHAIRSAVLSASYHDAHSVRVIP
ncbi:MAG: hypothetical protein IJY22_06565, partial [Clostridia bacterium]|nr:hypothetical protein [Clostridia bacterium]